MDPVHADVCATIEDRRDDMIAFLSDLVRTRTVTGQEQPGQHLIIEKFEDLGLTPDVWEPRITNLRDHPAFFETVTYTEYGYDNRPNVATRIPGTGDGPSLALSGHIDVVDPAPTDAWTVDPWTPTITDDRMYGRGTKDMKAGLAAIIYAYEAIQHHGIELAGDLILQSTIEEEAGGIGGVLSALERGYQPDAAIIPEAFGIPNIGIAGAGVNYFRIHVPGKTAHTARKFKGVNAIGNALKIYDALEDLDRDRRTRFSYEPAVNQDPDAAGNVTNMSVTVLHAGEWTSKIPGEAVMEGRVGWPPGDTRDNVRAEITAAIDAVTENDPWLQEHPPTLEWFGWDAEAHEIDPDDPIVRLARTHAEHVTGKPTKYIGGLGGLDERFYPLYYDIPAISLGPRGEGAHAADEWVDLDSVVETAQTLARITLDWCDTTTTTSA